MLLISIMAKRRRNPATNHDGLSMEPPYRKYPPPRSAAAAKKTISIQFSLSTFPVFNKNTPVEKISSG
jgi:hypothetical protein